MNNTNTVKGYKVFNSDWSCTPRAGVKKQYTCPGKFEEEIDLRICHSGMHFCKRAVDCFNYNAFAPDNKVAEVIAYGKVVERGDKCCTDKLEIVREIPWNELLDIVNTGKACTGLGNSGNRNGGNYNSGDHNSGDWNGGNCNSGNYNSGNYNIGNWNGGNYNSGNCNSGNCNIGSYNSGDHNSGDWNGGNYNSGNQNSGNDNSGNWNGGNYNSGNCNSGSYNSGDYNSGDWNSGSYNSGDWNSGSYNSGNCNSGDWNSGNRNGGNYNSGDWNSGSYNSGCFNTKEQKIYLFNKPSNWTLRDWWSSEARIILNSMPMKNLKYILFSAMTEEEKSGYHEAEVTGGYLKEEDNTNNRQSWWDELSVEDKETIKAIPNFDREIFKEITGIDVGE